MSPSQQLVWFRRDLRIDDHPALLKAAKQGPVLPLYLLDPYDFGHTHHGFEKTGPFRRRFLRESLEDLDRSLRTLGGRLLILQGSPMEVLPRVITRQGVAHVFAMREVGWDERQVETRLESWLKGGAGEGLPPETGDPTARPQWSWYWSLPMLHPKDLPMSISTLPDVFTVFRKQVEKSSAIRTPFDPPRKGEVEWVDWKTAVAGLIAEGAGFATQTAVHLAQGGGLATHGAAHPTQSTGAIIDLDAPEPWKGTPLDPAFDPPAESRAVLPFTGGETEGLERLNHYVWKGDHLKRYKETRNGLLGADYSSKFSPWLANGSISARRIHAEVKRYEAERVSNESTYWMVFELLWRDFFQFSALKHGRRLFAPGGIQGKAVHQTPDRERFMSWADARTGVSFIDANMTELNRTGFMSNRGRQNVASFLSQDLGVDWRMGAEYFESMLLDNDVASNWGNWAYNSTVGHDPRNRKFDVERQAWMYDRKGAYVKHWLG